jgi:DNA repair protein RadD
MSPQLRPYQRAAIDSVHNYWAHGGENPLVEMATGTGKSMVQAVLLKELLGAYPSMRVICLVHVRELVAQNAQAIIRSWPQAPIGINSASLGRRDKRSQILFASIQSVYKDDGYSLGMRELVMIDEAHLTPPSGEGMYRSFLQNLRHRVPDLRVAGLTATPFRTGSGRLDEGDDRLFHKTVFKYGIAEGIADGFLSPLISKATATAIDISGVKMSKGEFVQRELEVRVDQDWVTKSAVAEIIQFGQARKAWIAFCTGVDHAFHVRDEVRRHGVSCETVTGETPRGERDSILNAFKAGRIRCLTNCSVLTTGFDAPNIDMIAMLRPTASPGLFVQMVGRGTRLANGKTDCLVLDFAGNVKRHGPVDAINGAKAKKKAGDPDDSVRAKECPKCSTLLPLSARQCPECDHVFKVAEPDLLPNHDAHADAERPILSTAQPTWIAVSDVRAFRHDKPGSPTSMRVEYFCGISTQREWVCFEHEGFAREKAERWWRRMGGRGPFPKTADEAIDRFGELAPVEAVRLRPNGKFFEIVGTRLKTEVAA